MKFGYFSKDGQILPLEQAQIPLSNIAYQYGFGVYETLKVRNGVLYFVSQHIDRLLHSAELLELSHVYTKGEIAGFVHDLIDMISQNSDTGAFSCNLKMLLIGANKKEDAQLFILPLDPLYPNRKFYKEGIKTLTVQYERPLPNVKSLNMLMSFLAFRKAKEQECYDALLLDHNNNVLEGTRTNFYAIKGKTIITAGPKYILEGVTRQTVLYVAEKNGFTIEKRLIPFSEIKNNEYEGAFLTSTSSKIVPIRQIDDFNFQQISEEIFNLIKLYDAFLDESGGVFDED